MKKATSQFNNLTQIFIGSSIVSLDPSFNVQKCTGLFALSLEFAGFCPAVEHFVRGMLLQRFVISFTVDYTRYSLGNFSQQITVDDKKR
jgi:hypothetical protein